MPWTDDDVKIGEMFIEELKKYDKSLSFLQRMNNVANDLFYDGYNDPELAGVRSYIASRSCLARKNKKDVSNVVSPDNYTKELLENWDMQHTLHPEDEADLAEQVQAHNNK